MTRMVPAIGPVRVAQRRRRDVDQQPARRVVARRQRHAIERRALDRLAPRSQDFHEHRIEQFAEPPADGVFVPDAVQLLEAAVPAHHAVLAIDHREPVVERFEDVLAELPHPLELVRLHPQLPIETAVLERCRGLSGHGREQRHVLAAQRIGRRTAAERHDRDGPFLRDARDEVVDPRVAPEIELAYIEPALGQQIVERQSMSGDQPGRDIRPAQQDRRVAAEADVGDGGEVPVHARRHRREEQRHAIDEERLHDAMHQPLAQAEEVEIAVQSRARIRPGRGGSRSDRGSRRDRARPESRSSAAGRAARRRAWRAAR